MKNPGLYIEVSKEEFQNKTAKEQRWMLFEAIQRINGYGCLYGRTRWKKLFIWASTIGLIGGFLGGLARQIWLL